MLGNNQIYREQYKIVGTYLELVSGGGPDASDETDQ